MPHGGRRDDDTSRGNERPVQSMIFSWVVYIFIPAGLVAWNTTKQWSVVLGATLATPCLAIWQGAASILTYRVHFGDAPLPQTPSHGVVVVHPNDKEHSRQESSQPTTTTRPSIAGLPLLSLGLCECTRQNNVTSLSNRFLQTTLQETPLRLLVIGDSLAIGVGQAGSCTPIMPQVIAKTLSKKLGGRVVYWTCHGAPGASTGWIVREIERGCKVPQQEEELEPLPCSKMDGLSTCSDTDESSSDESSAASSSHGPKSGEYQDSATLSLWKERLFQHGKRFDHPDVLGPYDVVVVLTGSNDLKSAFFPFLLTGEDAEFRRQAKERGGSYTKELRRLLETLNEKMQNRIKNIVHTVEVATESVREKVEETMELIAPGSSSRLHSPRSDNNNKTRPVATNLSSDQQTTDERPRNFPLVVLPGMPARAIPIFKSVPLRWLSVPIVDIMDMHKRNFSRAHPGEVLFVPAPSIKDLSDYENQTGEAWELRQQEDTILSLRDTKRRDCRRIEADMRQYYEKKKARRFSDPGTSLFSVDQVHPCDEGYDFWGRYIGSSIAKEMLKKSL